MTAFSRAIFVGRPNLLFAAGQPTGYNNLIDIMSLYPAKEHQDEPFEP